MHSNSTETPISSVSGFSIKGISLVAPRNSIDSSAIEPIVDLHANSLSLMPYAFFSMENPEVKYNQHGQHWGENTEGVIGCIQLAHKNNMSVMLKPHLWIGRGEYTGGFTFSTEKEWKVWEESYRGYIIYLATLADSMNVEIFCIGTELGSSISARPLFWNALIDSVKKVYSGKLTYAANWDDYTKVGFWEKLDYIGVDAYFPLINDKTPAVHSLVKSWMKYTTDLEKLSKQWNRPILFTEYGYRNVDYNTAEPWKENDHAQNDEAQANALEALYRSLAEKKWFVGGYVWKWYTEKRRRDRNSIDFSPQDKPALKIIQHWYQR